MPAATDRPPTDTGVPDAWEERYRAGRIGWDRGAPSPALAHWRQSGWLSGTRVLVPGCGLGHEVLELARLGLAVTAVDLAPSAVASLRTALARSGLSARVVEADLLAWDEGGEFDTVYEQTCLCALPPPRWPEYAARLHAWLAPGGRLLASFMQTHRDGGPPWHCDPHAMRELFDEPRWRWLTHEPLHVPHSPGQAECAYVIERAADLA